MTKIDSYRRGALHIGLMVIVLLSSGMFWGCGDGQMIDQASAADIIVIDSISAFGALDRPPVLFPHDQHTQALSELGQDCETCHMRMEDGRLSQRFMRLDDSDRDMVMAVYHDECVACHRATTEEGRESGPVICGECHRVGQLPVSSRQPMGFDRSLHDRHGAGLGYECDLCHHEYDEATGETYYAEGEETTCRYCHLSEQVDDAPSLSESAHWACIGCHLVRPDAGPTDCAGCHDLERQQQIERVEDPRRLERGQPDFVLLRAGNLDSSTVSTVPFSHVGHENFNSTCRSCHHKSMTPCADCHTLPGSDDSNGITLQQAMHATGCERSCIGCHDRQKSEVGCAGCHSLMEQGRLSEHACTICHAGPLPDAVENVEGRYTSLDQFRPPERDRRLSFADSDLPDSVTIGVMADKYEPVVFPHRQVLDKLMYDIEESRIATHFHGHVDVVCQGCHHHSPIGVKPPRCENCHDEPFNELEPFKPGLYGAYHRQCLGCHQSMQIEEPSGCEDCHGLVLESHTSP